MSEPSSDQELDEDQALRALFRASLGSDGVAARIVMRTCGGVIADSGVDEGRSRRALRPTSGHDTLRGRTVGGAPPAGAGGPDGGA